MPDIVDTMLAEADAAIAAMQAAAMHARALHARAELLRHLRTTAAKLARIMPDSLPLDTPHRRTMPGGRAARRCHCRTRPGCARRRES